MLTITKQDYLKAWVLTTRPKTLILSCIPFFVGTVASSGYVKKIDYFLLLFAVLSALSIQIATNFINDVYDAKHNADKPSRLGPKRGIQSGVLAVDEVFFGGIALFVLAFLFGIPLILKGGTPIFLLLLASIFSGFIYTGGKKPLAYNGLGELFVILFFGLASTTAAFFFQTGFLNVEILLLGVQLGFFASIPIAINNLRDLEEDKKVHKKTLAVRFGKKMARMEIALLVLLPFVLNFYHKPLSEALIPFLVSPLSLSLIYYIYKEEPGECYNRFLGQSILAYFLFTIFWSFGRIVI
ncbi:MAG TPA: 1,4-dihydroxy-2-naphthoate octaprenyltransferase [Parachlamydiaceae bacterium]|nr:1,4-dihydroxy-2-naphthoate octaprenyltransferase [Parachlamydiaceae bacterium]